MSQQTGKRNEMVIDFVGKMECEVENMCRICGDCATNMIRIFEEEGLKQHLYEKLHRHFPEIEISEGNGFPSQVCNNCSSALSSWDDLYNTCMLVDKKLKAFLDNLERKQSCDVEKYIISVDMEPDNSPKVDEPEYSLIESEDIASDIVVESDSVFSYLDCSYENSVVSDCEERTEQDVCENKEDSIKEYVVDEDHINEFDGCVGFETDEMGVPKIDIEDETSPLLFQPALEYKKDSSHSELPFSEIDFSTALLDIDCSRQRMSCAASKSIANLDADQKKFEDAETLPERRRAEDAEIPDVPLNVDDTENNCKAVTNIKLAKKKKKNKGPTICHECGKTIAAHCLKKHLLTHSEVRNHMCQLCDMTFKRLDHLKSHIKTVHTRGKDGKHDEPSTRIACSICGKTLSTAAVLRQHHIVYHTNETPFRCVECNIEFSSNAKLWYHTNVQKHRKSADVSVCCEYCGLEFENQVFFLKHMMKHTGGCDLCYMTFETRKKLLEHKNTKHAKELPFMCNICDKRFPNKYSLRNHVSCVHENYRPHRCEYCDRCFAKKEQLETHVRRHTGERPYVCDFCGRGFAQKGDMRKHKALHYQKNLVNNERIFEQVEQSVVFNEFESCA